MELLIIVLLAVTRDASHVEGNPIYRQLIQSGVTSDGNVKKLPPPTLPDGLTAEDQRTAIAELGGSRYPLDRLLRKSVVAPQIVRVPSVPSSDQEVPLRTVDCWFVVYADLDRVADPTVLDKLVGEHQEDDHANQLTAAQLQERNITIRSAQQDHEAFAHVEYTLLDRVWIEATGHSFWSRTDESILAAVVVDKRFANDSDFPNRWSFVDEGDSSPHTYRGVGFYVKITQLKLAPGALFVEYHLVFAEPVAWFRGTNQLGAKLPVVIQSQVRNARREMMLASRRN